MASRDHWHTGLASGRSYAASGYRDCDRGRRGVRLRPVGSRLSSSHAIQGCKQLFTRFGGHAHAVGFSLPAGRLEELKGHLETWATLNVEEAAPSLRCHAVLPLDQITPALFSWLRRLEPLGTGNEEPVFVAYNTRLTAPVRAIKDRHICLQLAQGTRGASWSALGWDWAGRVQALGLQQGSVIHLAYKLRENLHPEYGGLELEDRGSAAGRIAGRETIARIPGSIAHSRWVRFEVRSRKWGAMASHISRKTSEMWGTRRLFAVWSVNSVHAAGPFYYLRGPGWVREDHPASPPESMAGSGWIYGNGYPPARRDASGRAHPRPSA